MTGATSRASRPRLVDLVRQGVTVTIAVGHGISLKFSGSKRQLPMIFTSQVIGKLDATCTFGSIVDFRPARELRVGNKFLSAV